MLAGRIRRTDQIVPSGEVYFFFKYLFLIIFKLRINKKPCELDSFAKYCGFVLQDDVMFEMMTPKGIFLLKKNFCNFSLEMITFSANLRLDVSPEEKLQRIAKVINILQLNDACNTYVLIICFLGN